MSRYSVLFYFKNFIHLRGVTIRYYGQDEVFWRCFVFVFIWQYPKGIYLDTASNNVIEYCNFLFNDNAIGLKRPSSRNVIQYNNFYDTKFQWQWEAVKNYMTRAESAAFGIYDAGGNAGRGNVIRRNTCEYLPTSHLIQYSSRILRCPCLWWRSTR